MHTATLIVAKKNGGETRIPPERWFIDQSSGEIILLYGQDKLKVLDPATILRREPPLEAAA